MTGNADVTIRGAGIFGLSIAWVLTQRGARVRVIDPAGPGAGSSGGLVGALAPHVPENWNAKKAFQLDSLLMAEPFWAEIETISGQRTGYARLGRLQPIADETSLALARSRAETARQLWQDHARWSVERAEGPWCPPSASGWIIRDTLTARLHPRQAIDALIGALSTQNVTVTPDGPEHGPIIWAAGAAGLRALGTILGQPVGDGVKGQAALLHHDARDAPQVFVDGLHIIPHSDGTTAIGSTSERLYDSPTQTDDQLDTLIARARTAMPVLADAPVLARWAGERPRARSRAPMLGPWPDRPGHFIANGGFKIGFGMAPKIAHVMADLVLEGREHIPDGFGVTDNMRPT